MIKERLKLRAWRFLTKDSPNIFLRSGDHITTSPMVLGQYEPHLTGLIHYLARIGYGDFLLDIGANIGLISHQCADDFAQIFCFEPNPNIFKILSVNCQASECRRFHLYNFGLGSADETVVLTVPDHNFGGAFIKGKGNRYSDEVLAEKDGFATLDEGHYQEIPIELRDARVVFTEVFKNVAQKRPCSGVIKIDVEGFEETVLSGLSQALVEGVDFAVVFENLDSCYRAEKLSQIFNCELNLYKLETNLDRKKGVKRLVHAVLSGRRWALTKDLSNPVGDLVFSTKPII